MENHKLARDSNKTPNELSLPSTAALPAHHTTSHRTVIAFPASSFSWRPVHHDYLQISVLDLKLCPSKKQTNINITFTRTFTIFHIILWVKLHEVCGSHSSEYKDYSLLTLVDGRWAKCFREICSPCLHGRGWRQCRNVSTYLPSQMASHPTRLKSWVTFPVAGSSMLWRCTLSQVHFLLFLLLHSVCPLCYIGQTDHILQARYGKYIQVNTLKYT